MATPLQPKDNRLLASLPAADFKRVQSRLELVPMPLDSVIYDNGGISKYAYFPADCIVSLLHNMQNGDSAEIEFPPRLSRPNSSAPARCSTSCCATRRR
jgi:hypothetical protein